MARKKSAPKTDESLDSELAGTVVDEGFDALESEAIGPQPGVPVILPLTGEEPDGYISRHLDVRLTIDQGRALKKLTAGLAAHGKKLARGRKIMTPGDSVRWILEQLIAAGSGA